MPRMRKTSQPTILDVALRAGVSLGTASNVLNGRTNVGAERRARVEAAIVELGYVPNGLAQSLPSASNSDASLGWLCNHVSARSICRTGSRPAASA